MTEKKCILVIEDHDSIRFLLGNVLGKKYSVVTLRDGLEGLAWLGKGNIPDLILLDLIMPRLNGIEFLINLKHSGLYRSIPVLVLSADESSEIMDKCEQLGISDYIAKPFNPIKLKDKIARLLHEDNA